MRTDIAAEEIHAMGDFGRPEETWGAPQYPPQTPQPQQPQPQYPPQTPQPQPQYPPQTPQPQQYPPQPQPQYPPQTPQPQQYPGQPQPQYPPQTPQPQQYPGQPQPQYPGQPQPQYPGQPPQMPTYPQYAAPPAKPRSRVALILLLAVLLVAVGGGAAYFLTRKDATREGNAQSKPGNEDGIFRVSFKSGETRTYAMDMTMTGTMTSMVSPGSDSPLNMKMNGSITISVIEQSPDGSTKIRVAYKDVKMTGDVGGMDMDTANMPIPPQDFTIKPDGTVTTADGTVIAGGSSVSGSPFGFASPVPSFPQHKLKEGDKWTDESRVPMGPNQSMLVTTDNVFEKYEETKWGQAARIWSVSKSKFAMDMSEMYGAGAGEGGGAFKIDGSFDFSVRYLFVPDTGEVVRAWIDGGTIDMKTRMDATSVPPGTPTSMDMQMNMLGTWERSD